MSDKVILSIDQGTTSSRAVVLSQSGQALSIAQKELHSITPSPVGSSMTSDIWQDTLSMCRQALQRVPNVKIVGVGITNQRGTTILEPAYGENYLPPLSGRIAEQQIFMTP